MKTRTDNKPLVYSCSGCSSAAQMANYIAVPLACSKACLSNHSVEPDIHIDLSCMGVPKRLHEDFDIKDANEILTKIESLSNCSFIKYTCEI